MNSSNAKAFSQISRYPAAACVVALFVLLLAASPRAWAASVSLTPGSQTVVVGQEFLLDVVWDFTDDTTIGGGVGIAISNPNAVSLVEFEFTTDPVFDPQFDNVCLGALLCGNDIDMIRGSFDGISGPIVAARLTFVALLPQHIQFDLVHSTNYGPFVSISLPVQHPDFFGAEVTITSVPLPAAIWVFAAALAGLGVAGRRLRRS